MNRRYLLGVSAGASLAVASRTAAASAVGPEDVVFRSTPRRLRYGASFLADMDVEQVELITGDTAAYMTGPAPSMPGFVVLAARDGIVVKHEAAGHRVRYAGWDDKHGEPIELLREQWEPMTVDTVFDLASLSKLFTATVTGAMIDTGEIDLAARVVDYLPEFDSMDPEKTPITLGQLLSHTSGMIAFNHVYDLADNRARMDAIFAEPLRRAPGTGYEYSDLNLIVLGKTLERVSGKGLDRLVADLVTGPLDMRDTGYNPPPQLRSRCAATEYQPWTGRGMIRGQVHDENAWSFGGVAGHAGVFSTAWDLAVFGQMILNGGRYGGARVLSETTTRLVFTNQNADLDPSAARGLGWQLDQSWYMDELSSPVTVGHTGFTGTSIVLNPVTSIVSVLLANRVHPTRDWGTDSAYRRAANRRIARAVCRADEIR
ncbi:serine hydrolase domain-containing protein [Glycomyces buryatensis]|uniref:Beta-lactamase family protein n=1 Tax=Glycomyces buryatensis TaxID=2570927 RepID=A0A4S8PPF3_9ACTN|nr:serine hydrolase domain-containing protein [Glycomyces buryatensis]THV32878.1 beta-lactamase family protein [Glycomyces buryatensis]